MLAFLVISTLFCTLSSSLISLGADRYPILLRGVAFGLLGIAGTAAIFSGLWVLLNDETLRISLPFGLPWLAWHLCLDPLSALFFIIVGLITIAASLFAPGYVREFKKEQYSLAALGVFTGLFVLGMLLVLLAADTFSFMVAWELMSLSSYFLVAYQHHQLANQRAAFLYLLMAHIGALMILLAFSILASFAGGFTFEAMRHLNISFVWATLTFGLGLVGFGMKAGLVPIHAWLPEAHPVAPSHISALMSGVMLKVAIYGLIRLTFDLLGTLYISWGVAMLLIGVASALLGILYALMQNDLKRLLAYSSIENIGIVCVGLGLSMLFIASKHLHLGALGLIAALYHVLNHATFKGLLFLSAGMIMHTTHERDLEKMGGLIHRLPLTSGCFLIGCLSISALPPFNGFVSEWLTFQTALQAPSLESGVLRALVPFSAAILALTGALSATCFVKAFGVAFLGQARSRRMQHARETDKRMIGALGFLATLCVLFGILPTTLIKLIETISQQLLGIGMPSASAGGWLWLTPISAEVASYSAMLVLISIVGGWIGVYYILSGSKKTRIERPWECGFGDPTPRMQYTATAFAMPIRRIFGPVWRVEEHIEERRDERTLLSRFIHYQLYISDRSWHVLYTPIEQGIKVIARQVGRIQTGNIRTYLAYSFFTLLLLLWLIT